VGENIHICVTQSSVSKHCAACRQIEDPLSRECTKFYNYKMNQKLTLPSSYHNCAWFLESTLQSNIALFGAGRARATDRPTFTVSCSETRLSWNGWEFGRLVNTATADIFPVWKASMRSRW